MPHTPAGAASGETNTPRWRRDHGLRRTRASIRRAFLLGLSFSALQALACGSSETANDELHGQIPADAAADGSVTDAGPDSDAHDPGVDDASARDADTGVDGGDAFAQIDAVVSNVVVPRVDPSHPDDLDKSIGMVVAVVIQGQPSTFGFGATEAHGSVVPDGDTVFQVGSVTKFSRASCSHAL